MSIRMLALLASVAGFCTLTSAAAAQENKHFDGFYLGAELGLVHEGAQVKDIWYNANDTNFYYGGILGYRAQLDSGLVLGLEGSLGDSLYKNEMRPIECSDCTFFGAEGVDNNWVADYKSNYTLGLSGTIGIAFGESRRNLVFLKSGYVKVNNASVLQNEDAFVVETNPDDSGWRIGGGYERAINGGLSLRLSADFSDYGTSDPIKFDNMINRRVNGTKQYQAAVAVIFNF